MLVSLLRIAFLMGVSLLISLPVFACDDPKFKEFDFWVGDWTVLYNNGTVAGRNRITRALNGCVLQEHYLSANGYEGKSLNIFNQNNQLWHQTWVDNTGLVLQLNGRLNGNIMALWGEGADQSGNILMHRITWEKHTPDPSHQNPALTQIWQVSHDQGLTWQTLFEGKYHQASQTLPDSPQKTDSDTQNP